MYITQGNKNNEHIKPTNFPVLLEFEELTKTQGKNSSKPPHQIKSSHRNFEKQKQVESVLIAYCLLYLVVSLKSRMIKFEPVHVFSPILVVDTCDGCLLCAVCWGAEKREAFLLMEERCTFDL